MKQIQGGVCAAKGFLGSGVHCGIRKNKSKRDLALIISETRAAAAAVYTQNTVKGAPLLVTKANLADGFARAVICNSGNANTCNTNGVEIAQAMCALVQEYTAIPRQDVIVASTGVIGQELDITPIAQGMPALAEGLSRDGSAAAQAIMTTDTIPKETALEFILDGVTVRLGGIAKGSGMIHPNMATMLSFFTTDTAISPALLQKALSYAVTDSFNMVSIDGDTSTNDMVSVLANGAAGNPPIEQEGEAFQTFCEALRCACMQLSRMVAKDGEGATKLLECKVTGAATAQDARLAAKAVVSSNLFKATMFGADANWGRVLCAIGYGAPDADTGHAAVTFSSAKGSVTVCQNSAGVPFSEEEAKKILLESEIQILVDLHGGDAEAIAWGCDLTYDYVKINGDYRT